MMHRQSLAEYQKVYLKINLTLETLPPPPKKKIKIKNRRLSR